MGLFRVVSGFKPPNKFCTVKNLNCMEKYDQVHSRLPRYNPRNFFLVTPLYRRYSFDNFHFSFKATFFSLPLSLHPSIPLPFLFPIISPFSFLPFLPFHFYFAFLLHLFSSTFHHAPILPSCPHFHPPPTPLSPPPISSSAVPATSAILFHYHIPHPLLTHRFSLSSLSTPSIHKTLAIPLP